MKYYKAQKILFICLMSFSSFIKATDLTQVYCGKLLDTKTGQWIESALIHIDPSSEKIIQIIPEAKVNRDQNKDMLNLSKHYCLPGLIDMHTHISENLVGDLIEFYDRSQEEQLMIGRVNANKTLLAGFTTVRDLGVYVAWTDKKLRDEINTRRTTGPRMRVSGYYLTIPGGGGDVAVPGYQGDIPDQIQRGVTKGTDNFRARAQQAIDGGADQIKIIASGAVLAYGSLPGSPEMNPEEIVAVVDQAKKANIKVIAHAHGALSIKQAILAGVDSIEHASLIDNEGINLAKTKGVALSMDIYNGDYINTVGVAENWPEEFLRKNRETTDLQRKNFTKAHESGVIIVYGTDAGVYPHGDNAKQFKYMVKYGMNNLEAIQSATLHAAEVIGMNKQVGQIKEGFFADLVAVRDNPLLNIQALENINVVIKGGKLYKYN